MGSLWPGLGLSRNPGYSHICCGTRSVMGLVCGSVSADIDRVMSAPRISSIWIIPI